MGSMNISSPLDTLVKNQQFSKLESIIHRWRQGAHLIANANDNTRFIYNSCVKSSLLY